MRIKVTLSYDGTNYYGYQHQPGKITVQDTFEEKSMSGSERKRQDEPQLHPQSEFQKRHSILTTNPKK